MGPLVSVVIPTFNRASTIERAVRSVLAQNYANFEVIVVDDASTDDTPQILLSLNDDQRVKLLRFTQNHGVSAARNYGVEYATGALITFLDSDDEWLPEKLSVQVAFMSAHPHAQLVQTQELWIRRGKRVNPGQKHLKKSGDIFVDSLKLCLISPSATMLRRDFFKAVGGFDETLLAAEDYDLWLRILRTHPAHLIDRHLVIRHGGHDDQLSAQHSLDKYRVMALEKILREDLSPERRTAAQEELERRRAIYMNGLRKRA